MAWHTHDWEKWKVEQSNDVERGPEGKPQRVIGKWILQSRLCIKCGFKQFNAQKITLDGH